MIAALCIRLAHQSPYVHAMEAGLKRHGVETTYFGPTEAWPDADFYVVWGWRGAKPLVECGRQVLVLERGYVGDRAYWTSVGWNGLNGRATFPIATDAGIRFDKHFRDLVCPWKWPTAASKILLLGQVPGDAALDNVDQVEWLTQQAASFLNKGYEVRFRPHPQADYVGVLGLPAPLGDLYAALDWAGLAIGWNSNSLVDAAIRGVPIVVGDPIGCMASAVRSQGRQWNPDRAKWFDWLAWTQYSVDELQSGFAWEHVRAANDKLS